jgi:hypothetical protein
MAVLSFPVGTSDRETKLSVENIVKEVRAEIARLQQVLVLLGAETGHGRVHVQEQVAPTRRKISAAGR